MFVTTPRSETDLTVWQYRRQLTIDTILLLLFNEATEWIVYLAALVAATVAILFVALLIV